MGERCLQCLEDAQLLRYGTHQPVAELGGLLASQCSHSPSLGTAGPPGPHAGHPVPPLQVAPSLAWGGLEFFVCARLLSPSPYSCNFNSNQMASLRFSSMEMRG